MMNTSLLCQTLGALSEKEYSALGEVLKSGLINSSALESKVISLHEFFSKNKGVHDSSYEAAFAAIYPGKPFNRRLLDNVMSAFMDAVREFIAWRQWRQREGEIGLKTEMARFYNERGLEQRFLQTVQQVRKHIDQPDTLQSPACLNQRFLLEKELYNHLSKSNDLQTDLNLPAVLDGFQQYFAAEALEWAVRLEHQNMLSPLLKAQYNTFADQWRANAKTMLPAGGFVFELFDNAIALLRQEASDQTFAHFAEMFDSKSHLLSFGQANLLASVARYYCTSKINRGAAHYRDSLLQLYKSHLDKGFLYENGLIPASSLVNMTNLAIRQGEPDWAWEMLNHHKLRIIGSDGNEAVFQFVRALIHFHQKDFLSANSALDISFEEMVEHDNTNHFKDMNLKLMARKLEIEILYEQDPTVSLLSDKLNAHKMFLHRNRHIAESHRTLHNNFVDLMKQLIQPACQTNPKQAQKLLDKLKKPGFYIADRLWVTEKVELLSRVSGKTV